MIVAAVKRSEIAAEPCSRPFVALIGEALPLTNILLQLSRRRDGYHRRIAILCTATAAARAAIPGGSASDPRARWRSPGADESAESRY